MTVGINIQPFLSSMSLLRSLSSAPGGTIDANAFLQAGTSLYESLDPEHVPGMPEERRGQVLTLFHQLIADATDNGQLFAMPAKMFLVQDLRSAGFFPDKAILAHEESVREFLRRLVRDAGDDAAAAIQKGGIRVHRDPRETMLGIDVDVDSFDDTLVIGALRTDGAFHIGRPIQKTLTAGAVPVSKEQADDDFDRRMTLQRHAPKPLTAQPIIDVAPVLGEAAPVVSDEDSMAEPLAPPPDRPEWQDVWQSYRKGKASLADFLGRFHRREVPMDFMRAALQEGVLPYEDVLKEVASHQLSVDDFLVLFSDCAFPLEPLVAAMREGKVPLFASNRESAEEQLASLGPFSGRDSLRGYLRQVEKGMMPLTLIRTALQEGLIPYRDLILEVADGLMSPEEFMKIFSAGALPAEPLLVGIRNGKLPQMMIIEALQDALRSGKLPFEPYLEAMQEGDFPLTNPSSGRLLIQKPLYLNRTQQTVPTIIESDYQLGHVIGEGGSSQVYLGVEIDTKREVAIKVVTVPDPIKRQKILEGFEEEIRDAPFSKSPRFVNVYSTGRTSQGNPFIAMELLSGGALADHIARVRMGQENFDLTKSIALACQVVAAAAEMHRHGYIHRDIKPENYFLDGEGNAKLGDQGLRKKISDISTEPEREPWGTPGTMPPEKVSALSPDDERTDVFALGVTLYELFTGIFSFEGPTPLITMTNVLTKQPLPPSRVAPMRGLPESLDNIVMKCMEKDPAKRYENAIDVLYDLVTVHAQELEREANEGMRMSRHTGADDKIHEDIWQEKTQAAIRELQSVYTQFPDPRIRRKMVELNYALHVWADRVGNEKELVRTRENIFKLDRTSPEARKIQNVIQANFLIDGSRPAGSSIGVHILHYEHRAGYFELDRMPQKKSDLPRRPLHLERGGVYAAQFSVEGMVSFVRDIPVRPGEYDLRIPFYNRNEIPEGWILIPAGPTAARTSMGSFAEYFENWREVDHDYAMGPLVTNADYFNFIKALAADDRELVKDRRLMPGDWDFDFFDNAVHRLKNYRTKDGQLIEWQAPVTHITPEDAQAYLRHLQRVLRQQGVTFQDDSDPYALKVRFPTLYEWRRAFRPDPREWAHGDGQPQVGDMAVRIRDPRGAGAIKTMRIDAPGIRDVSPFSVTGELTAGEAQRVVKHVVGNVRKFLHIGGEDDHSRISRALGLSNGQLGREFIAVAGADCSMSPADADILSAHPVNGTGLIGILPVIQLRSANSSPTLSSLTARPLR